MSSIRRRLIAKASTFGLPTRAILLATVVAVLALTAQASGTSATTGQGNAVTDWNEIAQNAIVVGRPTASSLVLEGIVQAAVYDAVVAIEGGSEPFVASPTVPRPASTAAAVAAAARGVLVARVPGQAVSVQAQYEAYLSSIPDGEAKTNGIAVGEDVAEVILAWRAGDGFDNVVPYVQPTPGPGVFEPVAPTTPIDVKLKQVRPLTYGSLSEFRPDGPNPLTSAEYAEDFNEVKAYGRADRAVLGRECSGAGAADASRSGDCAGPRRGRDRADARDGARRGRRRASRLLRRQVPLPLLAPAPRDPTRRHGRQPRNRARRHVDVAPHGESPGIPVSARLLHEGNDRRARRVLRDGQGRALDEQHDDRHDPLLRSLQRRGQGGVRRTRLGWSPLPELGHGRSVDRPEGRRPRGDGFLPADRSVEPGWIYPRAERTTTSARHEEAAVRRGSASILPPTGRRSFVA
jgi:hypothetical protein